MRYRGKISSLERRPFDRDKAMEKIKPPNGGLGITKGLVGRWKEIKQEGRRGKDRVAAVHKDVTENWVKMGRGTLRTDGGYHAAVVRMSTDIGACDKVFVGFEVTAGWTTRIFMRIATVESDADGKDAMSQLDREVKMGR